MRVRCDALVMPGSVQRGIVIEIRPDGRIASIESAAVSGGADLVLGTVVPGIANTHSHAFQRLLRGRTNADGGDFWQWRRQMYAAGAMLGPSEMFAVARFVYDEMRAAGYTAVGEFHYLHHQPDGSPYPAHDMEMAIAEAARVAGIRLTLLDTCYLAGGFGQPLAGGQRRFGDGSAERWLDRWHSLSGQLSEHYPEVTLGAAIHSVRAVPRSAMGAIVAGLPRGVPLHVHVSEQTGENSDCRDFTGMTPTELLAASGVLSGRTTVVHATHMTADDIRLLADARVSVALCPSTEADLGDGLGIPAELRDAGVRLAIGSDQHVVIDPFSELRAVEWMARVSSRRRGIFSPAELWRIGATHGHDSLSATHGHDSLSATHGHDSLSATIGPAQSLEVGSELDLVEINTDSVTNLGAAEEELVFSATPADVVSTVIRGHHKRAVVGADAFADAPRVLGAWRGWGSGKADLDG